MQNEHKISLDSELAVLYKQNIVQTGMNSLVNWKSNVHLVIIGIVDAVRRTNKADVRCSN